MSTPLIPVVGPVVTMDSPGVTDLLSLARWWRERVALRCSPIGRFESPLWAVFSSLWLYALPEDEGWKRPPSPGTP